MRILKHIVNGQLFEATPELLKNKKLVPASEAESQAYLAQFKPQQIQAMEKHTLKVLIPEDFDLDTDTFSFGKAQLLEVAAKLGLKLPPTMHAKHIKPIVDDAMAEGRHLRDQQRQREAKEAEEAAEAAAAARAGQGLGGGNGLRAEIDKEVLAKVHADAAATSNGGEGQSDGAEGGSGSSGEGNTKAKGGPKAAGKKAAAATEAVQGGGEGGESPDGKENG